MKLTFEEPKIEVIDFTVNDVIATSGDGRDPNIVIGTPITTIDDNENFN